MDVFVQSVHTHCMGRSCVNLGSPVAGCRLSEQGWSYGTKYHSNKLLPIAAWFWSLLHVVKMNTVLPVGRHGEAGYMVLLGPREAKAEQYQDNALGLCLWAGRWNNNHGLQSCFRFLTWRRWVLHGYFLDRETFSALLYCLFCSNRVGSETCSFLTGFFQSGRCCQWGVCCMVARCSLPISLPTVNPTEVVVRVVLPLLASVFPVEFQMRCLPLLWLPDSCLQISCLMFDLDEVIFRKKNT